MPSPTRSSVPQPHLDVPLAVPMRTEVEFKETESWCTLSYYEMNQRCGKAFEGDSSFYEFFLYYWEIFR